jgi:2'-5' RNA ligase
MQRNSIRPGGVAICGMLFSDPISSPAETLVTELRDYPEWHRGRARYGLWMIPLHDPTLLGYLRAAQRRLADLLHPSPQRQPHVTLFVCGFEQAEPTADDDFSTLQLCNQIDSIDHVRGAACRLPLGRPDSFSSAAFVPVGDPEGRLHAWRRVLGDVASEVRQASYVPHITLGLYKRKVGAEVVRQRLGELDAPPVGLTVTQLHYATYCARTQFGPLESRHRVMLD